MTDTNQPKRKGGKRPGAGRPKQHETPQALNRRKQAAHRERKRLEAQALALRLEQIAKDTKGLTPTAQHDLISAAAYLLGKPAPAPPTAQHPAGTQSLFPDMDTPSTA